MQRLIRMISIKQLTMTISLKKATYIEHATLVEAIFSDLKQYNINVAGCHNPIEATTEFFHAKPASVSNENKHNFIAFYKDIPIGIIDIINHFPLDKTSYIGLFAILEQHQGKHVGKRIFTTLEVLCKKTLHAHTLRLGVKKSNPVNGFWEKMGFTLISVKEDAYVMEKDII